MGTNELTYSDGIAAARTMLAVRANPEALQRRLPAGWELAPYDGDDLRGSSLRGANLLIPFHEVYAVATQDGKPPEMPQVSYVAFVSQARHLGTGTLSHVHWFGYTEDSSAVPGKYGDSVLADVSRTQIFTKRQPGQTRVEETFAATAETGGIELSLAYQQGGAVMWLTAETPNLSLHAARDTSIVRWYQEDQVVDMVRSTALDIDRVERLSLTATGELSDVLDGTEEVRAVVIQRPYLRRVYV